MKAPGDRHDGCPIIAQANATKGPPVGEQRWVLSAVRVVDDAGSYLAWKTSGMVEEVARSACSKKRKERVAVSGVSSEGGRKFGNRVRPAASVCHISRSFSIHCIKNRLPSSLVLLPSPLLPLRLLESCTLSPPITPL